MIVAFTSKYFHLSEEWSSRRSNWQFFPHTGLQYILYMSHTDSGGRTQVYLTAHIPMAARRLWHTANKIPRFSTRAPIAFFATKTFNDSLSWLTVTARAYVCWCVLGCVSFTNTSMYMKLSFQYCVIYLFVCMYSNGCN